MAGQMVTLTREQTRDLGGGLARFGYPLSSLLVWPALAAAAHISASDRRGLEAVAKIQGSNPADWAGSVDPLRLADTVVELLDRETDTWKTWPYLMMAKT